MARFLRNLAVAVQRRPWHVIALWAVVLIVAAPLAARQGDRLTGGGFEAPSSESAVAAKIIDEHFESIAGSQMAIVLIADEEDDDAGSGVAVPAPAVQGVLTVIGGVDGVEPTPDFLAALAGGGAAPGSTVIVPLAVDPTIDPTDLAKSVREAFGIAGAGATSVADGGATVHIIGQSALFAAIQELSKEQITRAESRAFPLLALALVLVFGSLVAAVPPLLLAVAALTITGGLLYLVSGMADVSVFASSIVSLVGLGVAVDYSLFIVARYRSEIEDGRAPADALPPTMATSGKAVIFSGLTVIASVCGLFLIDSSALRSMAVGAILVVTISILATTTLLPALITVLGRRVYERGRLSQFLARRLPTERGSFWSSWAKIVMRRPLIWMVGMTSVLLLLALPGLGINLGNSVLRQFPESHEFRRGVEAATAVVGPGAFAPVQVVIREQPGPDGGDTQSVVAGLVSNPTVVDVSSPAYSAGCGCVLVSAFLDTDPESDEARAAVQAIAVEAQQTSAAPVVVGGVTAEIADFDRFVSRSMWKILLFVSAISFVVLLVLLRSLLLPLKAVFMNLLSVGVAYGVLVMSFQWGWLGFLGLEKGPFIDTITPPLVLVIAYGLSMDYEVFLLSRMREIYDETRDNTTAVAEGLASSARTITSAALLMMIVFLAFVSAGIPTVQRIGLALATAIAVDATLVRLVIVPSTMALLGKANWWLPAPLARLLPGDATDGTAPPGAATSSDRDGGELGGDERVEIGGPVHDRAP